MNWLSKLLRGQAHGPPGICFERSLDDRRGIRQAGLWRPTGTGLENLHADHLLGGRLFLCQVQVNVCTFPEDGVWC